MRWGWQSCRVHLSTLQLLERRPPLKRTGVCVRVRVYVCVFMCLSVPESSSHTDVCDLSSLTDSCVSLSVKVCFFFHSINPSPVPFVDLFSPEGGCLLKGTEKRKSFYFLCARRFHEKGQTRYKLWVQFSTAVCQTPACFQQPFTHLSLLLSSCLFRSLLHFISIVHPPPAILFYSKTVSVIFSAPTPFHSLWHSRIRSCWAPRTVSLLGCCCFERLRVDGKSKLTILAFLAHVFCFIACIFFSVNIKIYIIILLHLRNDFPF